MKKIIAWLTKGTKIVRILTYIYKGLIIASAGFNAAVEKLKVQFEDASFIPTLDIISEYMGVAIDALEKILEWLGVDTERVASEARQEAEKKHKVKCGDAKVYKSDATLADITNKLKDELK